MDTTTQANPDPKNPNLSPSASSSSSIIKDGQISGTLPDSESFAVHYPGYPSSISRAIQTLGSLPHISKVRGSEGGQMELRFRPEDPYCHPVFGELRPATGLLLKISRRNAEEPDARIVTRVNHAYCFEGLADYQYVVPVHAAKSRQKKRLRDSQESSSDLDSRIITDMDAPDVMMLVPPLFSSKSKPENIVLKPASSVVSKTIQRGVVVDRWEMDIEPSLPLFQDPRGTRESKLGRKDDKRYTRVGFSRSHMQTFRGKAYMDTTLYS